MRRYLDGTTGSRHQGATGRAERGAHELAVVGDIVSGVWVEALGGRQDELLRFDLVVRLDRHLDAG